MKSRLLTILLMLTSVLGMSAQVDVDVAIQMGRSALDIENYAQALEYFDLAVNAKPHLGKTYFYRAIAKYNLQDYEGADADACQAVELNPFIADAWEIRGVSRQLMGRTDEAIADYAQALVLMPGNRQLLFNMALAHEDAGETTEARDAFTEVVKQYPRFENGYIGRARTLLAGGDTISAINDIEKAIALNRYCADAYVMRADIATKHFRDYDSAVYNLNVAAHLMPTNASVFINRGCLKHLAGDTRGSLADLDRALSLDPANEIARFDRAMVLSEAHRGARPKAVPDAAKSAHRAGNLYIVDIPTN